MVTLAAWYELMEVIQQSGSTGSSRSDIPNGRQRRYKGIERQEYPSIFITARDEMKIREQALAMENGSRAEMSLIGPAPRHTVGRKRLLGV